MVGKGDLPIVQDAPCASCFPGEADGLGWQEVVDRFGVPEWDTDPGMLIAPGGESWSGFVCVRPEPCAAWPSGTRANRWWPPCTPASSSPR